MKIDVKIVTTLALAALLLPALPTFAQTAPAAPAAPTAPAAKPGKTTKMHGKISALSATSITVTSKKKGAMTFAINPATTMTMDGKTATASDISVGQNARITSEDGTVATKIEVMTHKGKKADAPAAPVTPDAPASPATPAK